jgi:CBS domain-containing protein
MTKRIIYADYDDDIDYIESIMTLNKVRHLPIMKDKIITGLISIGDVVKASLSDKKYENKYLLDYIAGSVK